MGRSEALDIDVRGARNAIVSPDGRRAAFWGADGVTEVDLERRAETGRHTSGAKEITSVMYVASQIVVVQSVWNGLVWLADGRFR